MAREMLSSEVMAYYADDETCGRDAKAGLSLDPGAAWPPCVATVAGKRRAVNQALTGAAAPPAFRCHCSHF
jgi:hypothetical protein